MMIDLLQSYWTDDMEPNKEEIVIKLNKLGYSLTESQTIADKFFSDILHNQDLNNELNQSIREGITSFIKTEIKSKTDNEITQEVANSLFDTLLEEKRNAKEKATIKNFETVLSPLVNLYLETPTYDFSSLNNSIIALELKDSIPKEVAYLNIFLSIFYISKLPLIKNEYSEEDISDNYPLILQKNFDQKNLYYKSQKLSLVEYELNHKYYTECISKFQKGNNEVDAIASAFMMKIHKFSTNDLLQQELLWTYNFALYLINHIKNACQDEKDDWTEEWDEF